MAGLHSLQISLGVDHVVDAEASAQGTNSAVVDSFHASATAIFINRVKCKNSII